MKNIVKKIKEQWEQEQSTVLVTVIKKQGSAPRGVGAMMLVGKEGLIEGTIGGGKVEKEAIDEATVLLSQKKSAIGHYDLNLEGRDSIGMICGGSQDLYFRYMDKDDSEITAIVSCLSDYVTEARDGYLVIDVNTDRLSISERVPEEALNGELLAIKIKTPERAIIFGGGHVARALVKVLSDIDFECIIIESREEFADEKFFTATSKIICAEYSRIDDYIEIGKKDYIIVMTHGHVYDFEVLEQVLGKSPAYIGVMGSRRKVAAMNERLETMGFSQEEIASIHTPIGLSIGAVTPAEIAISIAAECIKVRASR